MKRIVTTVVGILIALSTTTMIAQASIPSIEQVYLIRLQSSHDTPWDGYFRPDGSATLLERRGGKSTAPAGSFSFAGIYNLLVACLKDRSGVNYGSAAGYMNVTLEYGVSPELIVLGGGFFIQDKETMRKIMYGLCDKIVPED
ncbi:MAG: hypothetical protein FWF84_06320, partial [Kiritimatiellaeota bacterium]|nr:hypothetical protein [Kiritimatiellota bacterium]